MKAKEYNFINIDGTILEDWQLKNHMEKIAISHEITMESNKNTYPIPRVKENFEYIKQTYDILTNHLKSKIDIYPAGEWILDNFYIIEETVKTIIKEMNIKKYKKLPGLAKTQYKGYSRVYVLASEIVAYTDSKIDENTLYSCIMSYQKRRNLSMEEIWDLWLFLDIALIEKIRLICEKIYTAQIQKYKVKSIIERTIENKKSKQQKFKSIKLVRNKNLLYSENMKYSFIEYMSYNLKKYGKKGIPYLEILEEQVKRNGLTIQEAIKKEHFEIAIR